LDLTMRLAEDIAERLGEVPGVAAVVLGGSQARGEARPNSDVDLGLYYLPDIPPVVEDLRWLARDLDDRRLPDLATDIGAWGLGSTAAAGCGCPADRWTGSTAMLARSWLPLKGAPAERPPATTSLAIPTASTSTSTLGRSTTAVSSATPRAPCGR
jgi:predicted nucleotidyltransferase